MMYLTVGELKKALKDVPDNADDAIVLYQRIEDAYFEKHHWKGKKLKFEDGFSEYIEAFSAYYKPKQKVFVINAHY